MKAETLESLKENLPNVHCHLLINHIAKLSMPAEDVARAVMSIEGDGLSYHTFEDIGRYTIFPERMFRRMFPSRAFGRFEEEEYSMSHVFGTMCREEGLRITNDLSRLTLPHERSLDYS